MSAVPKAVPSAVAPSASGSVKILTRPQLGPYQAPSGETYVPAVPRPDGSPDPAALPQLRFGAAGTSGSEQVSGGTGAPSVPPMGGALFTSGPVDPHYQVQLETVNPYAKVNNPPTRGMFTRVQEFLNHIAFSQRTTETGFKVNGDQQRTSVMLNTLPPMGDGYRNNWFTPRQMPQHPNTAKYLPAVGTQPYGTGVLNSDTFGAGMTAGGIGGSSYTPPPAPPVTTPVPGSTGITGMPTWG